jgi:alkanesulfonate monooxygenase SsuD/methylene tetrahydromethanopterin reductase-like flavin-dependent oxidoreductase (luciferase family)
MSVPDIGVFLPSMTKDPRDQSPLPDIAATARHAEAVGLESVWVIDQLVAGTGAPLLDSTIALATAAAATTRVRLGFGVLILPLRPVVWAAKQIASLQHVSGDRVVLGVGVGGDRHEQSWLATGVLRRERGRRTDAALRVLPGLVSGAPTRLADDPDSPTVRLSPAATMPPVLVGGMSDAALVRTVEHADGWFALPTSPSEIATVHTRLTELAAARGLPTPSITATMMTALSGDPALPDHSGLMDVLTDVDGGYGIPADQVPNMLVHGDTAEIAARLADYAQAGVDRVVVDFVAGDWYRQTELLAEAAAMAG